MERKSLWIIWKHSRHYLADRMEKKRVSPALCHTYKSDRCVTAWCKWRKYPGRITAKRLRENTKLNWKQKKMWLTVHGNEFCKSWKPRERCSWCATEIWWLTGDSQTCAFNLEAWSALDLALGAGFSYYICIHIYKWIYTKEHEYRRK